MIVMWAACQRSSASHAGLVLLGLRMAEANTASFHFSDGERQPEVVIFHFWTVVLSNFLDKSSPQ